MTESGPERPPILFLMLDSMRSDRLSLYGHDRPTTPNLSRLADEATVYENAVAPAAWTLPSHCSMFTGLYPSVHGVTNGFLDATGDLQLPPGHAPLATHLADDGYRTAGFSNNPWVGSLSGLDTGFDEFVEWNLEISTNGSADIHTTRDRLYSRGNSLLGHAARQPLFLLKRRFFTASLVERARRWLAATAGDPSFTFLNLMEAHSPYFPPRSAFRDLGISVPGPLEPRLLNTRLLAYVMGKTNLDGDRRRRVLEYYDAALRYQDRKVGELLDELASRGEYEDTLIVVCADHGKTLGEYGRDDIPPHYLRGINLTVPLVVKYPGQSAGRRVSDVVELRRLFDLVTDGGRQPLEATTDGSDESRRALVEEFIPHTGRERTAVTRWRALIGRDHKYIRSETGQEFLVERTAPDTRERPCDDDEARRAFASALDARVADLSPGAERATGDGTEFDADVAAQLEDLGYL